MYCEETFCWESLPCSRHPSSRPGSGLQRTHKAVRLTSGERPTLELRDEPIPSPGSHEVLIRVHAASLNYRDQALLDGLYPASVGAVVPLSDGAGEVVAVGDKVTRVKIGDRVASTCNSHWIGGEFVRDFFSASVGFSIDGWLAQYIVLHENGLVLLPDSLSYIEAATLACAAVTSWTGLQLISPLKPGQTILVQGTGGVSLFALQIAKMFGARVLAITSSDDKAEKLKELGAEAVVNYSKQPDWDREILALTNGRGVDKVIEIAGEKTIVKSAASTRQGGEVIIIGFASGHGGGLPPLDILMRGLIVAGSVIGPRVDFEALLAAMSMHKMKPVVDKVFPFADYHEAYLRLKSGKHVGKVVIDMSQC